VIVVIAGIVGYMTGISNVNVDSIIEVIITNIACHCCTGVPIYVDSIAIVTAVIVDHTSSPWFEVDVYASIVVVASIVLQSIALWHKQVNATVAIIVACIIRKYVMIWYIEIDSIICIATACVVMKRVIVRGVKFNAIVWIALASIIRNSTRIGIFNENAAAVETACVVYSVTWTWRQTYVNPKYIVMTCVVHNPVIPRIIVGADPILIFRDIVLNNLIPFRVIEVDTLVSVIMNVITRYIVDIWCEKVDPFSIEAAVVEDYSIETATLKPDAISVTKTVVSIKISIKNWNEVNSCTRWSRSCKRATTNYEIDISVTNLDTWAACTCKVNIKIVYNIGLSFGSISRPTFC
jgi:hypothetical protein